MTNVRKAEYLIQIGEAKEHESYSFSVTDNLQNIKDILTEVNKLKADTESSKELIGKNIIEFKLGNISVKMNYLGYNTDKELAELVFICEYKDTVLETDKFRLTSKMYKDSDYLENSVFRYAVTSAKRNKVSIFD